MPVAFLTDAQAAAYAAYNGAPSRTESERFFFLDDPTHVPAEVVDYLAEQFGNADASALKAYGERENTRLVHVRELRKILEYTEFAEAEPSCGCGWTRGPGRPGRARRRCATPRWDGCASAACCCPE